MGAEVECVCGAPINSETCRLRAHLSGAAPSVVDRAPTAAQLRAVMLPVLNEAVANGALTRREAFATLAALDSARERDEALDRLSQRTREKWQAEDERDQLRATRPSGK